MITLERIDHLVMTVSDLARARDFYARVLGMEAREFAPGRWALFFGQHKINLHQADTSFRANARQPTVGAVDICFVTRQPPAELMAHLAACGVALERTPSARDGALGAILSVYFRDPDGNLIELASYEHVGDARPATPPPVPQR